jgi:hypothetical protein
MKEIARPENGTSRVLGFGKDNDWSTFITIDQLL